MGPRLRRIWLVRLALLLCPVVVACAGFEIVLRRAFPRSDVTPFRAGTFEGVHSELRPSFDTLYKGVEIHINALGFRGPELDPAQDDRPRIAMIGDSFTFGSGVAYADTMAAKLEAELAERGESVRVLDFGVPGYNAANVRAQLEHVVLDLEPRLVIYTFFANDVAPDVERVAIAPDAVIDDMREFPLRSVLLQFVGVRVKARLRGWGLFADTGSVATELSHFENGGRERVREAVAAMAGLCAERGVEFMVLCYPFLTRPEKNPYAAIDRAFVEDCSDLGVECIELLGAFDDHAQLGRFWVNPFDSHGNGQASGRIARWIADSVAAALEVQSHR